MSNGIAGFAIIVVVGLTFLDKQYMYSSVIFRSVARVGESGLWMGCLGFLELALGALLARRFGLNGLLLSVLAALLLTNAGMSVRQPLRGICAVDRTAFRELISPSLILMGLGLGTIAIHNVDRVVVLWKNGTGSDLGQYQLAATLSLIVSQLPYIMMTVASPRLFRFDRATCGELRRYFLPLTAVAATSAAGIALLAVIVLPDFLSWYLPNYRGAAGIARVLMAAEACFALAMVADGVLVAAGRGAISLVLRGLTIVAATVGSYWMLSSGRGLTGVAWTMMASQAAGGLLLGTIAARSIGAPTLRYWGVATVPAVFAGGFFALVAVLCASLPLAGRLTLSLLAFVPLMSVPAWFLGLRLPGVRRIISWLDGGEVA